MDIAIKWPNDIYYHGDKKVGGIICQSHYNGRVYDVTIGIGINISNKKPTTCMDEIASNLQKKQIFLGRSTVLASFCNQFTEAIHTFRVYGFEPFMKDYLDNWMHSDEEVTVVCDGDESIKKKAIIRGINSTSGMLEAETMEGELLELYPDTHSLNLMDKLIYRKKNVLTVYRTHIIIQMMLNFFLQLFLLSIVPNHHICIRLTLFITPLTI